MFVIGSSYVNSLRSHAICIASSYLFVRETSDLLLRTLSHCLFHHYLHYWCDFTSCLIWVDHHLSSHIHCFAVVFYRCLWFISFPWRLILSLQRPISGSMLTSHHHYTYHYQFILLHLSPYRYHIYIRHPQVHGSWGSLYMLHFIYEGMSFDHWVFEPSFLSFLSPYHLGLRYVPCLKTTLRPWDQMSFSAASTWTGD